MNARALFLEPRTGLGCSDGATGVPVCAQERVQASSFDLLVRGDSDKHDSDRQRERAEPNRMTAAALPLQINRAYYDEYADHFRGRTAALPMNAAYEPFLRELPPWAHILDAGCGPGRNAAAFRSHGYRVTAIDASPAMVQLAKRSGIDARVMTFQQMTFNEEFDGIWASASVLHVPHAEISEVLNRFARALKPQGILYVSLKEGQSERVAEDGRFFSYFTLNEFSDSLTSSGLFKLRKAWKRIGLDSSGTMRTWLNFLAAKSLESNWARQ
ncbi:MAG: class I SAM-dependent methyltransferase [Limisphaerales bacterium]